MIRVAKTDELFDDVHVVVSKREDCESVNVRLWLKAADRPAAFEHELTEEGARKLIDKLAEALERPLSVGHNAEFAIEFPAAWR